MKSFFQIILTIFIVVCCSQDKNTEIILESENNADVYIFVPPRKTHYCEVGIKALTTCDIHYVLFSKNDSLIIKSGIVHSNESSKIEVIRKGDWYQDTLKIKVFVLDETCIDQKSEIRVDF